MDWQTHYQIYTEWPGTMKLTEAIIQKDLYFSIGYQRLIAVPNTEHWEGNGECDLLTVTRAMYTDEYEIKLNRSDFLADRTSVA